MPRVYAPWICISVSLSADAVGGAICCRSGLGGREGLPLGGVEPPRSGGVADQEFPYDDAV